MLQWLGDAMLDGIANQLALVVQAHLLHQVGLVGADRFGRKVQRPAISVTDMPAAIKRKTSNSVGQLHIERLSIQASEPIAVARQNASAGARTGGHLAHTCSNCTGALSLVR
jgi:hypothetical protein